MLDKSPETACSATKLILSGSVLEVLEMVSEKEKKVRDSSEKLLESIMEYEEEEVKKVLNTPKEYLLTNIEKDMENYEKKARSAKTLMREASR